MYFVLRSLCESSGCCGPDCGGVTTVTSVGQQSVLKFFKFISLASKTLRFFLIALGTYENCSKLHQERFTLDIEKHFCPGRVVKPWNRLPREVFNVPNLSVFKRAFGQCPYERALTWVCHEELRQLE